MLQSSSRFLGSLAQVMYLPNEFLPVYGQCAFCAVLTKTNFTGEKLAKPKAKNNTASALFSNCVQILKFFPQLLKVFSSPYCASRRCKQRGGGRKNFDRSFFAELHVWGYLHCQVGRTTTAIHLRLCVEDFLFRSSIFRISRSLEPSLLTKESKE